MGGIKMDSQFISGVQKINAALDGLAFSYRLYYNFGVSKCKELFSEDLTVEVGVRLKGVVLSEERARELLHNKIMAAVDSLVLIIDEALLDAFEQRDETNDLWVVIYMLRCAFAHGPCSPKWKVSNKYKRNIRLTIPVDMFSDENLDVDLKVIDFDFSKLDGRDLISADFYGLPGLLSLSRMAQKILLESKTPTDCSSSEPSPPSSC
jgi:hypothetical protein